MEYSTKLDSEEIDLENASKVVGLIVIQWGGAEHVLTAIVKKLWETYSEVKGKKIPFSLKEKIDFIRKCTSEPELMAYSEKINELMLRFETLRVYRDNLVHGAIKSFSNKENALLFDKFNHDKNSNSLNCSDFIFSHKIFDDAVNSLRKLETDTIEFGWLISNLKNEKISTR